VVDTGKQALALTHKEVSGECALVSRLLLRFFVVVRGQMIQRKTEVLAAEFVDVHCDGEHK